MKPIYSNKWNETTFYAAQDYLLSNNIEVDHRDNVDSANKSASCTPRNVFLSSLLFDGLQCEKKSKEIDFDTLVTYPLYSQEELSTSSNCVFSMKTYTCEVPGCNKSFTSSHGLKYHRAHGHLEYKSIERRPYVCQVPGCSKSYKNNNGLKYHIVHAHPGIQYKYKGI